MQDTTEGFNQELNQLEELVERRSKQGLILLIPLIALPILIIGLDEDAYSNSSFFLIVVLVALAIGGMGYSVHWGRNGRRFVYSIRVLSQIAPPYPTIRAHVAYIEKPPIVVVILWGSSRLYLVRMLEPEASAATRVHLPREIWRNTDTHQIDGLTLVRKEDTFVIPSEKNSYSKGEGILYAIQLVSGFWVQRKHSITRDIILGIIRQLNLDLAKGL